MSCPNHHTFVVLDIEAFARRNDDDQRWLRARMYEIVATALARAGIPSTSYHLVDRADGIALLIDAVVRKPTVAEAFAYEFRSELRVHNRRSHGPARIRMRMSLHAGDVVESGPNWVGTQLNTACRLVDAPQLRAALIYYPDAQVVQCVSDLWFHTVVRHDPGLIDHRTYLPIEVEIKELRDRAWLHVFASFPPPDLEPARWLRPGGR